MVTENFHWQWRSNIWYLTTDKFKCWSSRDILYVGSGQSGLPWLVLSQAKPFQANSWIELGWLGLTWQIGQLMHWKLTILKGKPSQSWDWIGLPRALYVSNKTVSWWVLNYNIWFLFNSTLSNVCSKVSCTQHTKFYPLHINKTIYFDLKMYTFIVSFTCVVGSGPHIFPHYSFSCSHEKLLT